MTREDIEHMWKVASNDPNHDTNWHDPVVIRFAALVASAEREACAKIVLNEAYQYTAPVWAVEIVNDIRARGQA
jgi:hypothetical protein